MPPEAIGGYYVAKATVQQVPLSTHCIDENATDPKR